MRLRACACLCARESVFVGLGDDGFGCWVPYFIFPERDTILPNRFLPRRRAEVLMDKLNQRLMRSAMVVLEPARTWCGKYVKDLDKPDACHKHQRFMAVEFGSVLMDIAHNSVDNVSNLIFIGIKDSVTIRDDGEVVFSISADDDSTLLDAHLTVALGAISEYHEMTIQPSSFPWAFILLLTPNDRGPCLAAMKREWELVLAMETNADMMARYGRLLFYVKFPCYRKIMICHEEQGWETSPRRPDRVSYASDLGIVGGGGILDLIWGMSDSK